LDGAVAVDGEEHVPDRYSEELDSAGDLECKELLYES
jgi:hypothetical protein